MPSQNDANDTTDTPDTITITCERPSINQIVTVTLPEEVVALLDYLAANTVEPDRSNPRNVKHKYKHAPNVIWADALTYLVPKWQDAFISLRTQAQIQSQRDAMKQQIQKAVSAIVVVDPADNVTP